MRTHGHRPPAALTNDALAPQTRGSAAGSGMRAGGTSAPHCAESHEVTAWYRSGGSVKLPIRSAGARSACGCTGHEAAGGFWYDVSRKSAELTGNGSHARE